MYTKKSQEWLTILLLVLAIALLVYTTWIKKDNTSIQVVNPTSTSVPTCTPVNVIPFETLMPTSVPTVIQTEVPTLMPTITPIPVLTEAPTITPTPVLTEAPTITPTIVPTAAPTITPTPVPTAIPTAVPTNTPTTDTTITIKVEVDKMFVGNEILPSYDKEKGYDLYYYIDMSNIDNVQLFWYLADSFIQKVAHSINLNFDGRIGIEALRYTLTSSYTASGKLQINYDTENNWKMQNILSGINGNEYGEANLLMLEFLYQNTIRNPLNNNERLLLVCK